MDKKKPVNLQLTTIRFPIPAIVSILHRVSGLFLFLLIPLMLCLLSASLESEASFNQVSVALSNPFLKLLVWSLVVALAYHIVAGFRHLLMDCGFGESRESGVRSAYVILVVAVVLIILAGIWIW